MGIPIFRVSSSIFDQPDDQNNKNPDPTKYKVLRLKKIDNFLIIKINYLGCKNYEGDKILVFKDCTMVDLVKQEKIDPHFSDNKNFISPIARFKPDEEGWTMAEFFVNSYCAGK